MGEEPPNEVVPHPATQQALPWTAFTYFQNYPRAQIIWSIQNFFKNYPSAEGKQAASTHPAPHA